MLPDFPKAKARAQRDLQRAVEQIWSPDTLRREVDA